jgi:hypothetical protein
MRNDLACVTAVLASLASLCTGCAYTSSDVERFEATKDLAGLHAAANAVPSSGDPEGLKVANEASRAEDRVLTERVRERKIRNVVVGSMQEWPIGSRPRFRAWPPDDPSGRRVARCIAQSLQAEGLWTDDPRGLTLIATHIILSPQTMWSGEFGADDYSPVIEGGPVQYGRYQKYWGFSVAIDGVGEINFYGQGLADRLGRAIEKAGL